MDPRDTHLGDTDSDSDSFVLVSSAPAPAPPATSSPAKAGLLSSFSFALEDYLAEESAYDTAGSEVEVGNAAITPEPADALDTEDADHTARMLAIYEEERANKQPVTPRIMKVNDAQVFLDRGVVNAVASPETTSPPRRQSPTSPRTRGRYKDIDTATPPDLNIDRTLWETVCERSNAIKDQKRILKGKFSLSAFFTWGVRYNPPEELSHGQRTLHVPVKVGTPLVKVLERVKTGQVFSATVLQTANLTGYDTVQIIFVDANAALAVDLKSLSTELAAPAYIVPTLTWPIKNYTIVKLKKGMTRCLRLAGIGAEEDMNEVLNKVIPPSYGRTNALLKMCREKDLVHLEFSSVKLAEAAYHNIRRACLGTRVAFEQDPCDPTEGFTPVDTSPLTSSPRGSDGSENSPVRGSSSSPSPSPTADEPLCENSDHGAETSDGINTGDSPAKALDCEYTGTSSSWADEVEEEFGSDMRAVSSTADASVAVDVPVDVPADTYKAPVNRRLSFARTNLETIVEREMSDFVC